MPPVLTILPTKATDCVAKTPVTDMRNSVRTVGQGIPK